MTRVEMLDDLMERYYKEILADAKEGYKSHSEICDILHRGLISFGNAVYAARKAKIQDPEDLKDKDPEMTAMAAAVARRLYAETLELLLEEGISHREARRALGDTLDAISLSIRS